MVIILAMAVKQRSYFNVTCCDKGETNSQLGHCELLTETATVRLHIASSKMHGLIR